MKSKKYVSSKQLSQLSTTLTVVVAVRNEEDNILNLLNDLKAQSYSAKLFDVIIVDDHSTDNTADIVSNFEMPNLRLIRLNLENVINSYP